MIIINYTNKKLAIYLPTLAGGGAERVCINLARGFAECGLSVDLVVANAVGALLHDIPNGVQIVDLNASRVYRSIPALVRYLRKERPEALLSAMGHANVAAIWARKLANVSTRVVITEHANLSQSIAASSMLRVKLMPFFMRHTYSYADQIIAVSHSVADELSRSLSLPREEIKVIYNPVIAPEFFSKLMEPVCHPWFANDTPPVILSAGRLNVAKDFPTLIHAFAEVRRRMPVKLVIIGEGEERDSLESLVKKLGIAADVDFPGFVDNPYAYMARASVFVLSSIWEGFGNVLVEALACRCPVVSTNCPGGPAEILENGEWGKLVPVGDIHSMVSAIETILTETAKRETGNRYTEFTIEKITREYASILF